MQTNMPQLQQYVKEDSLDSADPCRPNSLTLGRNYQMDVFHSMASIRQAERTYTILAINERQEDFIDPFQEIINPGRLAWVKLQQPHEQRYPFLSVFVLFSLYPIKQLIVLI